MPKLSGTVLIASRNREQNFGETPQQDYWAKQTFRPRNSMSWTYKKTVL